MNEMDKSIRFLLMALPWVYWSASHSPYEIPKTWVILLAAAISLVLFIKRDKELVVGKNYILGVVGGLWGMVFFSSILSGHFWQSFWGNYYRADGLLTLSAMIVLGLTLKLSRDDLRSFGWVSVLTSIAVIVTRGSSGLFFGNQVFLAGYLAITLPFAYLIGRLGLLVQICAIAMLGVWGASLAAISMVLILIFRERPRVLIAGVLVASIVFFWIYQNEQFRRGIDWETVGESRMRIWTKAILAIYERPLFGWGWAQYGEAFQVIKWPMHYDHDVHVDRSHASITEYGVSGGLVAMVLYTWLMIVAAITLWNSRSVVRRSLGYACILYIIYSQTNVTSVVIDWLFFASIGEAIREKNEQVG